MTFDILLQQLIDLSGYTKKELSEILGYHNSYITKWTSGAVLPAENGLKSFLKSMATAFTSALLQNGNVGELATFAKVPILLTDYASVQAVIYRLLENAYYISKHEKNNENEKSFVSATRTIFGYDNVVKATVDTVFETLIEVEQNQEFFITIDLSKLEATRVISLLNTTITRKSNVTWNFLIPETNYLKNISQVRRSLFALVLQTAPHRLKLHEGTTSAADAFILCKNRWLCHYRYNEHGELIAMFYTTEPEVLGVYLQRALQIFRPSNQTLHTIENHDFEFMLCNGMPMPDATLYITSMFFNGFFLDKQILDRQVQRGTITKKDQQACAQMLSYYKKVMKKNTLYFVFPYSTGNDFLEYGEIQVGSLRLCLDERERKLYLKRIKHYMETHENIIVRALNLKNMEAH